MNYIRAHKIRLEPTEQQHRLLSIVAGANRFVYNWALDKDKELYVEYKNGKGACPSWTVLCRLYTQWKNTEGPEWLQQLPASTAQHTIRHIFYALQCFFKGIAGYPKYHKKGRNDSFYITNQHGSIKQAGSYWYFRCPNIGWIKLTEEPRFQGKIISYIVSHKHKHWYVSVQYQLDTDPRPACEDPTSPVGIDVGVKTAITCSDGSTYQLADVEKLRRKLKYQQRYLSRAQKKSNNRKKYLEKVRSTTERIQNKINDSIHKATTTITKKHGIVVVENLNVAVMKTKEHAKFRTSRRNLQHACMAGILRQLAYKAQQCFKVDRFFPSSQLCSVCGHRQSMPVTIRQYVCSSCGNKMDRDLNAAINILQEYFSGRVTPVVSCG